METNELHRGRLIDHLHLVVPDLARSKRFYAAILEVLGIPMGGEGPGFFWVESRASGGAQVSSRILRGVFARPGW
jgi:predicted enzyme related to lactoylglutathione lyase